MAAAAPFAATHRERGYQPVHTSGCACPGCGRSQWLIGRTLAECAACFTAIPLGPETARG